MKNVLLKRLLVIVFSVFMVLNVMTASVLADTEQKTTTINFRGDPSYNYTDKEAILKKVNEIRLEAFNEGLVDEYVPMKWSSDMEEIAYQRSAETGFRFDHTRPNGTDCFTVKSSGGQSSYSEIIASTESPLLAIDLWYTEKSDYVAQKNGDTSNTGITGHYKTLILPEYKYIGIASFSRSYTVGEASSVPGSSEVQLAASGSKPVSIEVSSEVYDREAADNYIYLIIDTFGEDDKITYSNSSIHIPVKIPLLFGGGIYFDWFFGGSYLIEGTWKSDNEAILTVDQNGIVIGRSVGTAHLIFESTGLSRSATITVYAPEDSSTSGILRKGATGTQVCALQTRLAELGYDVPMDGGFGNITEQAVKDFQKAHGITPDGEVGPKTRAIMFGISEEPVIVQTQRTLKKGMTGEDVKAVQQQLVTLGYLTATPDGIFGGMTEAAVKEFQIANGLGYSDGMVGAWTRNKLANNPVAKTTSGQTVVNTTRTLKKGMTGEDVKSVQQQLVTLGYLTATPDGIFGRMTEAAVSEFQIANGLGYSDGMVGAWTRNKLANNPVAKTTGGQIAVSTTRTLKKGMTGEDVKAIQQQLVNLGYLTATPDGIFGGMTEAAVNEFQIANGLGYSDGMVGAWTRNKLNNNPVAKATTSETVDVQPAAAEYRTLKKGMRGDDVLQVQQLLHNLGYLTATPDGIFGAQTEAAVNAFQIDNGLGYSDGMVGAWTRGKLGLQ